MHMHVLQDAQEGLGCVCSNHGCRLLYVFLAMLICYAFIVRVTIDSSKSNSNSNCNSNSNRNSNRRRDL